MASFFIYNTNNSDMRKITNPWRQLPDFRCFGCSPDNPYGLRMEIYEGDNGEVVCRWHPESQFQGWPGVLHGGIQCTLMDEIAAWVVSHDLNCDAVTSKLNTKFIKPVLTSDPFLTIKAKLTKHAHKLAWIETWIENAAGERCAEAEAIYFITKNRNESL